MLRMLTAVVVLVAIAAPAALSDQTFYATIVPRPGTGSSGSGTAVLVLNSGGTTLSYTIAFSGLTSEEQAAHIHAADGSVAHQLPLGNPKIGVWQNLGFIDVTSLQAGQLYILIHTADNPGGELRGNINTTPLPVETTTWSRVKALYAVDF